MGQKQPKERAENYDICRSNARVANALEEKLAKLKVSGHKIAPTSR